METEKILKICNELVEELVRQELSLGESLDIAAAIGAAMVRAVAKDSGERIVDVSYLFIRKYVFLISRALKAEMKGGEG